MPAVTSGKVLVTGANGFIGVWTVKAFLDAGFSVRAQVRSESKTAHLKSLFSSFGDKLEFAIVADLTKDGSLDDAVAGVDAVAHTASPTNLLADHPDEHIKPAVEGTLNCLRAAVKASSVKRFLYLSSCATVVDPSATGPRVYDESCWNTVDDAEVEAKGRGASQLSKYRASKILAERSAWKFYEEAKATGSIGWDLTVVNPPWVFGPSIQELGESYESMNASDQHLYKAIVKGDYYAALDHSWIDVRDLAHALVLAITTPAAGGERFIVAGGDLFGTLSFGRLSHFRQGPPARRAIRPQRGAHRQAKRDEGEEHPRYDVPQDGRDREGHREGLGGARLAVRT